MTTKENLNLLKENIKNYKISKENGINVLDDLVFKSFCFYPLCEEIEKHWTELSDEEKKEYEEIKREVEE